MKKGSKKYIAIKKVSEDFLIIKSLNGSMDAFKSSDIEV